MLHKFVKNTLVVTLIFFGSSAIADGHTGGHAHADGHAEDKPYPTFGLETFACNYNEGKGLSDLLKVSAKWSEWATETMDHPYSAWLVTPMFFDSSRTHDVYWLGSSDTESTLGAVQDQWLKTGAKYQAAFNTVINCDRHTMFRGETLRFSLDDMATGNAQFFACSFKDTATPEKFIAGTKGFRAFVDTLDLKEGIWRWWPGAGHFNRPEWDYLEVVGSGSLEQRFANKAKYDAHDGDSHWVKNNGDVLQCAYVADANYIQIK